MSESDKNNLLSEFGKLDKSDFFYLPTDNNQSIEEKLPNFSLKCRFKYPANNCTIDINDVNMEDILTTDELDYLEAFGGPIALPSNDRLNGILKQFSELGRLYRHTTCNSIAMPEIALEQI